MAKSKTKQSLPPKTTISICPKCGNTDVKNIYLISPAELSRPSAKKLQQQIKAHPISAPIIGWQPENQAVFICKNCDYNGICPEIDVSQRNNFRKQLKNKKH